VTSCLMVIKGSPFLFSPEQVVEVMRSPLPCRWFVENVFFFLPSEVNEFPCAIREEYRRNFIPPPGSLLGQVRVRRKDWFPLPRFWCMGAVERDGFPFFFSILAEQGESEQLGNMEVVKAFLSPSRGRKEDVLPRLSPLFGAGAGHLEDTAPRHQCPFLVWVGVAFVSPFFFCFPFGRRLLAGQRKRRVAAPSLSLSSGDR